MVRLWLLMALGASALVASGFEGSFAPDFAPMKVYEGTWTVVSAHTMAGDGKPDTIVNHCTEGTAFYTCEQVVNGKSLALLVFTATDDPAKFHTQPVLPSGLAAGRGDLTMPETIGHSWEAGRTTRGKRPSSGRRTSLPAGTRSTSNNMSPATTRPG